MEEGDWVAVGNPVGGTWMVVRLSKDETSNCDVSWLTHGMAGTS